MITGGDLRQSRLDVGYKTFTISPWGGPSFGHVSTDINGTVYSFGRDGMWTGKAFYYYAKNNFRDGLGILVQLTPDQGKRLKHA